MSNLGKEDERKLGSEAILKIVVMLRYGKTTIHRLLTLQLLRSWFLLNDCKGNFERVVGIGRCRPKFAGPHFQCSFLPDAACTHRFCWLSLRNLSANMPE